MCWRQYWTEVAGVLEELVQLQDQRLPPKEDKVVILQSLLWCNCRIIAVIISCISWISNAKTIFWISVETALTP